MAALMDKCALKHCNALSAISLILGRISLTSQRELLVKDFPKPHLGIFWITSLKDKQKEKILTMMILFKAGKTVDNTQKYSSTSVNEKFKIRKLTFQNEIFPKQLLSWCF